MRKVNVASESAVVATVETPVTGRKNNGSVAVIAALKTLQDHLRTYSSLAIAVSGGVDSMTLATVASDVLNERALLVHAQSPAVPPEATARVRQYAKQAGWRLTVVSAGEFDDDRYRDNPVNRCYYCKSNLYQRLSEVWPGTIASGANLDDLGDYRPGLLAASERQVVHPLIQCNIDKAMVRKIASYLQMQEIADLPAQPCLSSRVETGITIDAGDLAFVHRVEQFLANTLGAGDFRCRVTAKGIRVEVPELISQDLIKSDTTLWEQTVQDLEDIINSDGRVFAGISDYQRGSAFLHDTVMVRR